MEIKIEISDERFDELFKSATKEPLFTDDELRDIFKEAIIKFATNSDLVKRMFVEPELSRGYNNSSMKPTKLTESIVSKLDINDDIKELKDAAVDSIKNKMPDILCKVLLDGLMRGFRDNLLNDSEFRIRTQMDMMQFLDDHRR